MAVITFICLCLVEIKLKFTVKDKVSALAQIIYDPEIMLSVNIFSRVASTSECNLAPATLAHISKWRLFSSNQKSFNL